MSLEGPAEGYESMYYIGDRSKGITNLGPKELFEHVLGRHASGKTNARGRIYI